MKQLALALSSILFVSNVIAAASNAPALYLDVSQPVEQRVADLISRLTLEEKATLLNHRGPTVERFNIRSDQWNQCLNGVQWDRPTTLFPTCIAMIRFLTARCAWQTAVSLRPRLELRDLQV